MKLTELQSAIVRRNHPDRFAHAAGQQIKSIDWRSTEQKSIADRLRGIQSLIELGTLEHFALDGGSHFPTELAMRILVELESVSEDMGGFGDALRHRLALAIADLRSELSDVAAGTILELMQAKHPEKISELNLFFIPKFARLNDRVRKPLTDLANEADAFTILQASQSANDPVPASRTAKITIPSASYELKCSDDTVRNKLKKIGVVPEPSPRKNTKQAALLDVIRAFDGDSKYLEGVEKLRERLKKDS